MQATAVHHYINHPTPAHTNQRTDPSVLGLQLYLKFFFITERESIFSYVHVEEEQVGEVTAGLGQGERGEETAGGVGMRAQRRQQSVGGVLRLTAADDDGDSGRDPLCLD